MQVYGIISVCVSSPLVISLEPIDDVSGNLEEASYFGNLHLFELHATVAGTYKATWKPEACYWLANFRASCFII